METTERLSTVIKVVEMGYKTLPDVDEWLKMLKESEKQDHLREIRDCGLEYAV